jgi:polysaccharide export outer membrane protein
VSTIEIVRAALIIVAFIVPARSIAQDALAPMTSFAPAPSETAAGNQSDPHGDVPVLKERYPRYQVTKSDVLSLSFPLSAEFDREVTVQPDGYINLHGTRSVYVQNLTVPEIVVAVKKAYANVLRDPIIDVDLVEFQKPFFVAGGQIGKPGQYELRHNTTLSQAIALAGGIASGGKTQIFLYRRVAPDLVEVKKLNLKNIYHGKDVNEDVELQTGDTLFVPEKFITVFRKYVPYSVGTAFNPQAAFTQ